MAQRNRFMGKRKIGSITAPPVNVPPSDPTVYLRDVKYMESIDFSQYKSIEDDKHISREIRGQSNVTRISPRGSFSSVLNVYQKITTNAPTIAGTINKTGWGSFLKIPEGSGCPKLVEALLERWWYTTHTFHFNCGEMGITTTDWIFITGMKIGEGTPLDFDDITYNEAHVKSKIFPELETDKGSWKCNALKLKSLRFYFEPTYLVAADKVQELRERVIRAFCMFFVGSVLFPNSSSYVASGWLACFDKFESILMYDWGGAAYAYLIYNLDEVTKIGGPKQLNGAWQVLEFWFYEHLSMVRPDPCTLSPYDYPRAARWTEAFKRIVFSDVEEWHSLLAMRNLVATLTTRNVFNYPWSLEVFTDESYRNLVSVRAKSRIILSYGQVHVWYMGDRLAHQEKQAYIIPDNPPDSLTNISLDEVAQWLLRGFLYYTEVCVGTSKSMYKKYWRRVTKTGNRGVDWDVTLWDTFTRTTITADEPEEHSPIPPMGNLCYVSTAPHLERLSQTL